MGSPIAIFEQRPAVVRLLGAAAAIVALTLAAGIITPAFTTFDNLSVIVRAASITGIVAIGMSYVTISGNLFALSASSQGAFLAVIFALTTAWLGLAGGLVITLLAAILSGMAQGAAISLIGNPIITTLAFGTVFRGLAALLSANSIVRIDSDAAVWFGTSRPAGIPTQSWIFVLLGLLSWFVIKKTRAGREIVLTGANPDAARSAGVSTWKVGGLAFVALSLCVAVMSILTVSQFSQAKADLFSGYDFDYIAAVLVGGIALRGGRGSPLQAAMGAILIALLQNFMLLNGFSAGLRMTIVGALVVISISVFHIIQGNRR